MDADVFLHAYEPRLRIASMLPRDHTPGERRVIAHPAGVEDAEVQFTVRRVDSGTPGERWAARHADVCDDQLPRVHPHGPAVHLHVEPARAISGRASNESEQVGEAAEALLLLSNGIANHHGVG